MNETAPADEPPELSSNDQVPTEELEHPRESNLAITDPSGSHRSDSIADLQTLDRVAILIIFGAPILGLLGGAHLVLERIDQAGPGVGGWIVAILGATYLVGAHALAGLAIGSLLRVLGKWLLLHQIEHGRENQLILQTLADRLASLTRRLTEQRSAPSSSAHGLTAIDLLTEQAVAEIRRLIRAREWEQAAALVHAFSRDHLDDSRVPAVREELKSARDAAREDHLTRLDAARQVNDPDRVLELHQVLIPLLESEARVALEADLSKWFLRLIHNRLRTGKIQADLAILAGRIAEVFSHTVEGASLRAALSTLRRSAGLCPRCAQPYTGLADACPACLHSAHSDGKPPGALSS